MALETATYIDGLVTTNPVGATDPKGQGDDHIRLIKAAIKATFPNITGPVTKTQAQLNDAQLITLPTGTKMMFVQTAAPTGWTKDTTHDNKALRVVSGAAGTGGTVNFTTAFASKSVSGTNTGTAITTANLPSHTHTQQGAFNSGTESVTHFHSLSIVSGVENQVFNHTIIGTTAPSGGGAPGNVRVDGSGNNFNQTTGFQNQNHTHTVTGNTNTQSAFHIHSTTISGETAATGSGTTHTHTFTGTAIHMAVQYVDCIIATKN